MGSQLWPPEMDIPNVAQPSLEAQDQQQQQNNLFASGAHAYMGGPGNMPL